MEPISVVVKELPNSIFSQILPVITGVIVPILLVSISYWLSNKAERRSINYTNQLRYEDKKSQFISDAHLAIDSLYKDVQRLFKINVNRANLHEEVRGCPSNKIDLKNADILNEARVMLQDLLIWQTDHLKNLDNLHGDTLIDVVSSQTRVQLLLTEEKTKELDKSIEVIREASLNAGGITNEMMSGFVGEINDLMKKVENDTAEWIKL